LVAIFTASNKIGEAIKKAELKKNQ
jgi:hypothetical protein